MAKAQRTKPAATQVCPTCGKSVVPDDGYCPNCGSPIDVAAAASPPAGGTTATSAIVCPVCSTTNPPGAEFCSNCGAPLAQVLSTPLAQAGDGLSTGIKCGVCGHDIPPGEDYCANCGAPRSASVQLQAPGAPGAAEAPPSPTTCPNCGAKLRPGARFCRECGTRFDSIASDQKSQGGLSQLKPGQVLAGRYKIQSVIGGGGMGAVFKGVDMNLTSRAEPEGRQVAVKAILDTTDPELLAAAVEEREMLVRLDHPNIVRIYDIVNEGGVPYIVMAYVKGKGWKQLYEENGGPLPESEALRLLLGMRGAFEYLHHRVPPVVYRDFKPGQVIEVTDPNGEKRQVLIDLGTAMEHFPGQRRQAWGTVGFAPPEIGGIVEQPPTMDLFGIVSTLAALLGVAVDRQPILAPPRREWPVSEEIYDLVVRGRDPDPRVRFQTVEELFNQLEGINRFIQGQERARVVGSPQVGGTGTRTLSQVLVPVQSTLITGKLLNQQVTGKISALPVLSGSDPAQQLLQPARDLVDAGRYVEALGQLDVVLRQHPASIDGHLLRATALNNLGRTDEARSALDQANRLGTPATRWRTLLVQAQAAETQNDYRTAEAMYQELIKLVPGEVLPKQALADLYSETRRYDEAADLYSRVVAADPANADAVLGWADSLVALNRTDVAIGVLDAVNENALRYVDAQLRLVELYLSRIDGYLTSRPGGLDGAKLSNPDVQGLLRDLDLAGRAIAALNDRTESRHFYRLQADWWYAAYRLSRAGLLPQDISWPDSRTDHSNKPDVVGHDCRQAYRRYLQRAPDAPDREEVLARIYFDVREWQ